MIDDNDISMVCFISYMRSKLSHDEKIGLIRGIPSIVKKTWLDRLKDKLYAL